MRRRQNLEKRKQWHPILVDGLRYLVQERLRVEPEHALASLPTRVDVLLVSHDPAQTLPFPYNHFGLITLVELATPGKWLDWRGVRRLLWDWVGYSLAEKRKEMQDVCLWLVGSRVSPRFLAWMREEFGELRLVAEGMRQVTYFGSKMLVVSLHELPLSLEALPLLMVYQGPREAEIAEFVVEHGQAHPFFLEQAVTFHARALKEALEMKGMNVEAYRKLVNLGDIIDFFGERTVIEQIGEEKIIREIGEEKIIREIGEEKIIREIGEERVMDDLLKSLGPVRLREMLERHLKEHQENGG